MAEGLFPVISQWRILLQVLFFRETSLFTRQVVEKLTDTEYFELQAALLLEPEGGDFIPGTGGLSAEEKKALRKLIRVEFK